VQQGGYVLAAGLNVQQQRTLYNMPRPKPPEPLKPRFVRMSDSEWRAFKELGGAEWLRKMMRTKPRNYYEVFKKPEEAAIQRAPKTFESTRIDGVVAFHTT
jgi:hypothetical protein